ncbi:hypothetical protein Fmac_014315 [Flemingia macrophylla]|uniref:Bromo domain-containing protein n=1 Tax=Flemingia macrophylla TaxID=520843 RepID=A0ABD1MBC9_9FABA
MRFEEETKFIERRRSSRIVALEEKRLQERERKLAEVLERKKNDIRNKGKGKATMEVCDDNQDEESLTKKKQKSKELYQLISSIKVEHYYDIIKQPMDFGTMRAKLHEGMYTNFDEFKAEDISRHAKWIFEALSADSEQIEVEFALNKKHSSGRPHNGQQRTSRRASSTPAGRKNSSSTMVPETEKRDMYWPPSKPLVSDVLDASKPIIQVSFVDLPNNHTTLTTNNSWEECVYIE